MLALAHPLPGPAARAHLAVGLRQLVGSVVPVSDEAGELRAALERGDWRRLTDPLLPLVLLQDPGPWWGGVGPWDGARRECAQQLAMHLCGWREYSLVTGSGEVWLEEVRELLHGDPRLVLRGPREVYEAALAVLERWPAG